MLLFMAHLGRFIMRLDKFLADLQAGTRSQVKEYIRKGLVTVNGVPVKKADSKIDETTDIVCCQGKQLTYQKFQYYMLHKPAGVVTATKDNHDKTVMDLLSDAAGKNLSPVGRLDKDTEGLLLITNDGELSHNLLSPKKHVAKTYYVECEGSFSEEKRLLLQEGVSIGDGELTKPAIVKLLTQDSTNYTLELTITEGRFHQVKRMIHAVGGNVTYLKRLSMGSLVLDDSLEKGCYRELTPDEVSGLQRD